MKIRRDKNLKALLPSVMVSSMGDWIFHVALLLYLFKGTQSGVIVSLFILSSTLPSLLLSPLIVKNYIVLRTGQRWSVLICCVWFWWFYWFYLRNHSLRYSL
ncbi:hypothetical protein P4S72_04440 [Vibrio sp. PP-XX7]